MVFAERKEWKDYAGLQKDASKVDLKRKNSTNVTTDSRCKTNSAEKTNYEHGVEIYNTTFCLGLDPSNIYIVQPCEPRWVALFRRGSRGGEMGEQKFTPHFKILDHALSRCWHGKMDQRKPSKCYMEAIYIRIRKKNYKEIYEQEIELIETTLDVCTSTP